MPLILKFPDWHVQIFVQSTSTIHYCCRVGAAIQKSDPISLNSCKSLTIESPKMARMFEVLALMLKGSDFICWTLLVSLDRCQFKMLMLFSLWYWFETLWISSKFTKLHHHSRAHTHLYTHKHKGTLNLIHIETCELVYYPVQTKKTKKNHSQRNLVHLLTRNYYVDVYTNIY